MSLTCATFVTNICSQKSHVTGMLFHDPDPCRKSMIKLLWKYIKSIRTMLVGKKKL